MEQHDLTQLVSVVLSAVLRNKWRPTGWDPNRLRPEQDLNKHRSRSRTSQQRSRHRSRARTSQRRRDKHRSAAGHQRRRHFRTQVDQETSGVGTSGVGTSCRRDQRRGRSAETETSERRRDIGADIGAALQLTRHRAAHAVHRTHGPPLKWLSAPCSTRTQLNHGPLLAAPCQHWARQFSMPYRTGKIAPTHTHQAATASRKVTESGQDGSQPLHQDDGARTALVSR
nr:uncharacterized protein LOC119716577 [Anas platyrhynchos]